MTDTDDSKRQVTDPEIMRVLGKWGLSEKEAAIYLASLKVEVTSPFSIARETGIPRTTVYTVLADLALKGLVEIEVSDPLQKQQTKVKAKNPSELRSILWKKRNELIKTEVELLSILPLLKQEYVKERVNANFRFYPGIDGVKEVLWGDEVDQEMLVMDYQTPMDAFGSKWVNEWVDRGIKVRRNAKTKEYNLIPLNDWTRHVLGYQISRNPDYLNNAEYRTVDAPLYNQSVRMWVKGEYVSVTSVEGKEVWGLKVRSAEWAKSLSAMFWVLWNLGKPVDKKMVDGWGINEFFAAEEKIKNNKG